MKRLVSLILVICLCLPLIPIRAEARTTIVKPSGAEGRDFSIAYASKLDNIFQGTAALFSNSSDKYALGQSMRNSKSYAVANTISGYQCYIYANAVYYYLFGDIPYHGSGIGDYWKDSKTVITNQASASYTSFKNAGVDFGAYIRTTGNKNGSFSASAGHSMIVLRYDSSTITFLEGNADGKDLVRITQETWTEFNSSKLSGRNRRICHIVQPESVTKAPSTAGLSLNKTVGKTGESFTFTFSSDAPCVYDISIIDADTGACVVQEESTSATYKRSFQKAGHYTARVTARNSNGSKDSAPVEFWVFGSPPVSASFQADQTTIDLGDTVTLSSRSDAEYVRFSASMFLYNDSNEGTKIFSEEVPATFIYEPAKPGVYKGNVTAWTHEGRAESNWVTFYVGKYTVKYDTNGGSGTPAPQTKYYGRDITLTTEKPSRKNHHFLGWAASPTAASAAYQPGGAFAENADTTLYAVWKHICADGHLCDSYSLTKAPTAAAAGALTGPCPKCGETATVTMPKLNTADYEFRVTTPPTCSTSGMGRYTWKNTAYGSYSFDMRIASTGHSYGEWCLIREPAEGDDGLEQRTCGGCGHTEQRPILQNGFPFTDMPADSFYEMPVLWALENDITNGLTETTFGPAAICNRAQVVTFLWRAAGCPEPTGTANPFVDVEAGSFYVRAVLWALENGITNGADAARFDPNGVCSRAQVVTFLYRAFGSSAVSTDGLPFGDIPAGSWYAAPIAWAMDSGITNGLTATEFGPNAACNRAQVATFLYRAYNG